MEEISEKLEPTALGFISEDTQAVELEFIKAYEKLPLLWDRKHPEYSNKYKRNTAYDILVQILKKSNSAATRLHVRQKINILRSLYRRDLRRHQGSKTIGPNGAEYEYTPNSWKYNALKFLGANAKDSTFGDSEITDTEIYVGENVSYEEPTSENTSDEEAATVIDSPPIQKSSIKESRKRPKYEREVTQANEFYFVETNSELLDKEYDAIGSNVACKLKRMSPQQRCHAELLINKVLIYGLQNNLTDDTDLTEVYKS